MRKRRNEKRKSPPQPRCSLVHSSLLVPRYSLARSRKKSYFCGFLALLSSSSSRVSRENSINSIRNPVAYEFRPRAGKSATICHPRGISLSNGLLAAQRVECRGQTSSRLPKRSFEFKCAMHVRDRRRLSTLFNTSRVIPEPSFDETEPVIEANTLE